MWGSVPLSRYQPSLCFVCVYVVMDFSVSLCVCEFICGFISFSYKLACTRFCSVSGNLVMQPSYHWSFIALNLVRILPQFKKKRKKEKEKSLLKSVNKSNKSNKKVVLRACSSVSFLAPNNKICLQIDIRCLKKISSHNKLIILIMWMLCIRLPTKKDLTCKVPKFLLNPWARYVAS